MNSHVNPNANVSNELFGPNLMKVLQNKLIPILDDQSILNLSLCSRIINEYTSSRKNSSKS